MGDHFIVLVGHLGVPAHLAVAGSGTQGFLLAGQADFQRVAVVDGFGEAQVIDAVVGENRAEVGIDKQARGERHDQVAVRDAAVEERIFCSGLLVGVRIECIAGEFGKVLNILE